jgi:L-fuculose-phosphate aldolase
MADPDPALNRADLRGAVHDGVPTLAELTPGRTGNLSARDGEAVAITPSGVPYVEIDVENVPVLSIGGDHLAGEAEPSSETPMHLGLYRSLDVGAIAHVHAPFATTLAVLGEELPPVHYMLALAGGTVPVAPYEPFGTEALADAVVSTMEAAGTSACLLANHGLVAAGETVSDALETVVAVESTARLYLQASAVGEPTELDDEAVTDAVERFEGYGERQ